jgi:hypothetical protein
MSRCLPAIAVLTIAGAVAYAQQPRDNRSPLERGTARVAGVVRDAQDGRPLRRARVSLSGSELQFTRVVITADDGSFTFEGLPPGRFSLTASKDGHVSMNHGAARPGRPGRTLTLAAGASSSVDMRLPRGAVITGAVVQADGEPASGIVVTAFAWQFDAIRGERRLVAVPNAAVITDDRGVYRIFGLREGSYYVAAQPRLPGGPPEIEVVSTEDVRSALAEIRQGLFSERPGMPPRPASQNADVAGERQYVTLAPIFFPGTPIQERASAIEVKAGEVRQGVNLDLDYVPTASVDGFTSAPQGMRVMVELVNSGAVSGTRSSSLSDDGRFVFRGVPPGQYSLVARAFPRDVRTTAAPAQTGLWGETHIVVAGDDISGITLPLLPSLSISGRVVVDGSDAQLPQLLTMRVPIPAVAAGGTLFGLPSVVLDGSRFSMQGVQPGTYRFMSPPRGIRAPIVRWWLKSLVLNGKEALDAPLELRESTDDAVLTLSEQASELTGFVRLADGTPPSDGFVVVFAADPRFWFHQSRRVVGVRLPDTGKYVVRNLPAGDYLIAASEDIDLNEWFDPEMLKSLAPRAVRITLGENEAKSVDIPVRR